MLNTLHKIALKHGTDKADNGYAVIYQTVLHGRRKQVKSILEVGIQNGYSLKMWEEYFPNAMIHGIDIDDKSFLNAGRIMTIKGDQGDPVFLQSITSKYDIILDDGGHTMRQQMLTLGHLFQNVNPGGIYILEDLGTSLMPFEAYGGNTDNIDTALSAMEEFARTTRINSKHITPEQKEYIEKNTLSVHIYGDYEEKLGLYNKDNLGGIAAIMYKSHD